MKPLSPFHDMSEQQESEEQRRQSDREDPGEAEPALGRVALAQARVGTRRRRGPVGAALLISLPVAPDDGQRDQVEDQSDQEQGKPERERGEGLGQGESIRRRTIARSHPEEAQRVPAGSQRFALRDDGVRARG